MVKDTQALGNAVKALARSLPPNDGTKTKQNKIKPKNTHTRTKTKQTKTSQERERTLQAIAYQAKTPKATMHANSPASGDEMEMPILENRVIRVSKKRLHKLKDFFAIVLSKDEKEGEAQRKNTHLLLPAARLARHTGVPVGKCGQSPTCFSLAESTQK